LTFKSIIKNASSSAVVHLINGIYKKSYPLDTPVKIEPTEFVKEHPKSGKLEKIVSDIIVTLSGENFRDTYLMEAQINDDVEMSLRIFNYSIFTALEGRKVSDDGSSMQIDMPSPAVIFWESSKVKDIVSIEIRFPDERTVVYKVPVFKVLEHSVSELEGMALLLPFYILKIRKELKKRSTDAEKRKILSSQLEDYIIEIDKVLKKCKQNNYISARDVAMLLHRLLSMNLELYGQYPEFTEVDVTLKKFAETDINEIIDKGIAKGVEKGIAKGIAKAKRQSLKQGVAIGMEKVFALLEKGMSLAEAKKKLSISN
jgi:hypothetical protein